MLAKVPKNQQTKISTKIQAKWVRMDKCFSFLYFIEIFKAGEIDLGKIEIIIKKIFSMKVENHNTNLYLKRFKKFVENNKKFFIIENILINKFA